MHTQPTPYDPSNYVLPLGRLSATPLFECLYQKSRAVPDLVTDMVATDDTQAFTQTAPSNGHGSLLLLGGLDSEGLGKDEWDRTCSTLGAGSSASTGRWLPLLRLLHVETTGTDLTSLSSSLLSVLQPTTAGNANKRASHLFI